MTAAVLIPIVFFSFLTLRTLLDSQREAVLRGARESLRASVLIIDGELSNALTALNIWTASENVARENWGDFHAQVNAPNADIRMATVVFDDTGRQIMNSFVPFGTQLTQTIPEEKVPVLLGSDEPPVSDLIFSKLLQRNLVAVHTVVSLPNGHRYIIVQSVFASHLAKKLPPMQSKISGLHDIFDRNGTLIATNNEKLAIPGTQASPELRSAMLKQEDGTILGKGRNGENTYTLFARSPLSQWAFTVEIPASEVDGVAFSAVKMMGVGFLSILLAAASTAIFFGRRLRRSITHAVKSASGLGKGIVPSPHDSGITELEQLQLALHDAGRILQDAENQRANLLVREKEARTSAETANAAKDDFLAMLGHELRNPLSPISSAAQLLASGNLDAEKTSRVTNIIIRQVKHMTHLINDLLDVSRVTRGLIALEKNELDMKSILSDAVEQVQPAMNAMHHHIEVRYPQEPGLVLGDHKRLVQVFTNLLANAAKYTPQGGNVTLTMTQEGDCVITTVADNGVGMTPDLLGRAFDLFAQAHMTSDRSQGGLGLGLALVKSLVAIHGGTVTAQSDGLNKGSVFTVSLPRAHGDWTTPADQDHATAVTVTPSLRLLIVDDNKDAANMLGEVMKTVGHVPLVEYDARGALDRAAVDMPDVCLLDIGLPDMDGYELGRKLRAEPSTRHAVLIALTGYGQQSDFNNAMASGFNHHFVKPVDHSKLAALLADIAQAKQA